MDIQVFRQFFIDISESNILGRPKLSVTYSFFWFVATLMIGLAVACLLPQNWFHSGWVNQDQGWYLSQLDQLLAGERIYGGVATPYGPLPYTWHHALATIFGNNAQTYILGQIVILSLVSAVAWSALSRVLPPMTAFIGMVLGILPFHFKVIAFMIYEPLTVLEISVIVLMWRPPSQSTLSRNLFLGIVLGAGQWVKFGHFAILGGAILIVDVLASWQSFASWPSLKLLLHRWCFIALGFFFLEIPLIAWVLWYNPDAIGIDAIWPFYQNDAYAIFGIDERMPGGLIHMPWKLLVGRILPGAFLLLAVLILFCHHQRKIHGLTGEGFKQACGLWQARLSLLIPVLTYLIGCFSLFSSTNHLWHYAWLLGWSIPWIWQMSDGWFKLALRPLCVACAMITPMSWLFNARSDTVKVRMPDGFSLYLRPAIATAWNQICLIDRELFPPGARIQFLRWPGLAHFLNHPPPTRHVYPLIGWVRTHEKAVLDLLMNKCWAVVTPAHEDNELLLEKSGQELAQQMTQWQVADEPLRSIIARKTHHIEKNQDWVILYLKQPDNADSAKHP